MFELEQKEQEEAQAENRQPKVYRIFLTNQRTNETSNIHHKLIIEK